MRIEQCSLLLVNICILIYKYYVKVYTKRNIRSMKRKNVFVIFAVTLFILMVPFISMWPLDEFDWGFADFVSAGAIIFGTGLLLDLVARKVDKKYRLLGVIGIILVFFLLWAELAVGIFNSPIAGN